MDSELKGGQPAIPGYLSREVKDKPVPRLRDQISKKIRNIHSLNGAGIKLIDDQIMRTFDAVLDQQLQGEAALDMKRFSIGPRLSREGIEYKKEMSERDWQRSPTLKLAELIVIKTAGMDALSDEELEELDRSIQDTYKGIDGIKKQRAAWLMDKYFEVGRKLTPAATIWLEDTEDITSSPRPNIVTIIDSERQSLATVAKTP